MKPEGYQKIIETGLIVGGILTLSQLAFAKEARFRIFKRDRGICQNPDCFWNLLYGHPARWEEGFNMQCAHYPPDHTPHEDHNIEHGRLLCTTDHIFEEILRGNDEGARLLWEGHTIRRFGHGADDDMKMPLDWYYDWVEGGREAREGLLEAYIDEFKISTYGQPRLF